MIKKITGLILLLFLSACSSEKNSLSRVGSEPVITVGKGEICGGTEKTKCDAGLRCKYDTNTEDLHGICIDDVVDDSLDCPDTKKPVCGLKKSEREKNGYLNACEAERHGAIVLHERFCKIEETTAGDCGARVLALGNCEKLFVGYEFDGNSCQQIKIVGCNIETPFESMAGCISTCE